jgi:threonine/homoserine/homoserine lactone efflux protein
MRCSRGWRTSPSEPLEPLEPSEPLERGDRVVLNKMDGAVKRRRPVSRRASTYSVPITIPQSVPVLFRASHVDFRKISHSYGFEAMSSALPYAALSTAMTFALVMSITPGPNNTMLLASGVNFGFRRTLPHMMGVTCGCIVMMIAIALGLGQIFVRVPALYGVMEALSVAYLLYLAWKIAASSSLSVDASKERPMTFFQAAAFQWVNPKAWMMVVTGVTAFHLDDNLLINALALAIAFAIVNLPSISVWAAFGLAVRRFLSGPIALRAFNWTMAALLVASILPTVRHGLS